MYIFEIVGWQNSPVMKSFPLFTFTVDLNYVHFIDVLVCSENLKVYCLYGLSYISLYYQSSSGCSVAIEFME